MDLLIEIRSKLASVDGHSSHEGVTAAIRHVEVAERWLQKAREEADEDLFNDVIYRTNQAFEGMLKEAYHVLTGQEVGKMSPYQIEQHLLTHNVFTARVLDLFKNYRQQWRNPSTHDHSLFFGEDEALLAIVSVSAFAAILLDQITSAISFKREQEEVSRRREHIDYSPSGDQAGSLHEDTLLLLELFSEELAHGEFKTAGLREVELIGRLGGFIESLDPRIKVIQEPRLKTDLPLRPDLILDRNGEVVVLELKRAGLRQDFYNRGKAQVLRYLEESEIDHGVLYIAPTDPSQQVERRQEIIEVDDRTLVFSSITPSQVRRPAA